jgi:signal transduction histidine kinase
MQSGVIKFFLAGLFFLCNRHIALSDTIVIKGSYQIIDISPSISIYEDVTANLSFEDARNKAFERNFKKIANLGISKSVIWVKIGVTNLSLQNNFLLNFSLPTTDYVEFFQPNKNGNYTSIQMGEHLPFYNRVYNDPDYIFDLFIPSGQTKLFFLKIRSNEGIQLPLKIGTTNQILEQEKNKGILSGIYFGIMLVIILYNLFIYFSVRDKNYLYYVVYVLLTFLTQSSLQGYTFQFLWPNYPSIAQYSLFLFPCMVGVSGIMFMKSFLHVKSYSGFLNNVSFVLYIPYIISVSLLLFQNFKFSQIIMEINAMMVALYMLITPIVILRKGFKPAKFFLIAWSIFLIGICVFVLKDLEILPFNNFTRYTMQIGSAIETVLLSFALADRINILKKEKEFSQALTLEALKENEKLITEQNILLEQMVTERTAKLNNTNKELEITLTNLKETQVQLVNAEKMATLGQLTAGIAHEINNPINFVSANIKPLKLDIEDILELLKKYETISPNQGTAEQFKSIQNFRKEIDIEYLKKEMEDLLLGIEDGAKRTAEIVSGLKNFSRLDESEIKTVNINDGIESTLILLKSAIPKNARVVTKLGNIPLVECMPGKLNQVFMNLFNNALDAIKQKEGNNQNQLSIETFCNKDNVIVTIEDTGIGMTNEVKEKIFEPFFTTKDVGQGTGLGMSIVYKIIKSHQAEINIDSQHGVGTKISLILKLKIEANLTA